MPPEKSGIDDIWSFFYHKMLQQRYKSMDLIDDLTQRLLGYWATAERDRYHKRPPKYESYLLFMEASSDLWHAAFEAGFEFNWWNYQNDPALKSLHGYPPFEEFMRPRG